MDAYAHSTLVGLVIRQVPESTWHFAAWMPAAKFTEPLYVSKPVESYKEVLIRVQSYIAGLIMVEEELEQYAK